MSNSKIISEFERLIAFIQNENDKYSFKVIFKGNFIGYFKNEDEASVVFDKTLIDYIKNKYGEKGLSTINPQAINNPDLLNHKANNLDIQL